MNITRDVRTKSSPRIVLGTLRMILAEYYWYVRDIVLKAFKIYMYVIARFWIFLVKIVRFHFFKHNEIMFDNPSYPRFDFN